MPPPPSILAISDHTGWAHFICVSARNDRPIVVTRRRVALVERGLPTQPYEHDTRAMRPEEAEALVAKVRKSIEQRTETALRQLVGELAGEHPVAALTMRTPPFDALPATVAAVHASYPLLCAADGLLYHVAIRRAAARLGLEVEMCRRGGEMQLAAEALGVAPDAVEAFVAGPGRPAGPPWTGEHRRGYAAAIAALATRVGGLTIS